MLLEDFTRQELLSLLLVREKTSTLFVMRVMIMIVENVNKYVDLMLGIYLRLGNWINFQQIL